MLLLVTCQWLVTADAGSSCKRVQCHRVPNQGNSTGVSVYQSYDLVNWEFEGRFCYLEQAMSLC